MVDTREVFAGLYAGGRQPPWKARLDELLPDPAAAKGTRRNQQHGHHHHHAGDAVPAEAAAGSLSAGAGGAASAHEAAAASSSAPPPLSASAAAPTTAAAAGTTKRKQAAAGGGGGEKEGDEQTGPFYDEGADLKDELWVTDKYLRHHQPPRPKQQQQQPQGEGERGRKADRGDQAKKSRPDDWTSDRNDPLTRPRRSDAVLSCPCCFTPLCYDCQRHDVYLSQYRAMFVTDECTARLTETRTYEGDQYHPVHCAICETEVGVFEPADELYHFFNVVPGN